MEHGEKEPGLYRKFEVRRVDGRDLAGRDKSNAKYFVLDYVNDPYAKVALEAYATACTHALPELARDLLVQLDAKTEE